MDFLILEQYGTQTYQRKSYHNIYEYFKILNEIIEDYLDRRFLNLVEAIPMLKKSQNYLINFAKKYSELNDNQIQMFPYEIKKGLDNIERLKQDNLYDYDDEYYIFKYVDFVYNIKILFDSFQKIIDIMELYSELNYNLQHSEKVVLNKKEPVEEQVFYYQQELKPEIVEYFKENLKGKFFEDILAKDLDSLSMFPNTDFWLFGIYLKIDKINQKNIEFIEFIENYNIGNYVEDLKYFQKFKNYKDYTIQLLKDKEANYYKYLSYMEKDPNTMWMFANIYKNLIIPEQYFLNLRESLLKDSLNANAYIKIEFFIMLDIAIKIEMLLFNKILLMSDDIFLSELKFKIQDLDNAIITSDNFDLLSALMLKELLLGLISMDDIDNLDELQKKLIELGLINKDLKTILYLAKNELLNKELLLNKINNFIKSNIEKTKDLLDVADYFSKKRSLPSTKYQILQESISDLSPANQLRNDLEKEKDHNKFELNEPKIIKNKLNSKINSQLSNNIIPKMDTDFLGVIAIKNALYVKNVAEKLNEILNSFPIVSNLNGNDSLAIAKNNFEKNKNNITNDTLKNSLKNSDTFINPELFFSNDIVVNTSKSNGLTQIQNNILTNNISDLNINSSTSSKNVSNGLSGFAGATNQINLISDNINSYKDKIDNYMNEVSDWISVKIGGTVEGIVDKISNFMENKVSKINNFLNSTGGFINSIVKKVAEFLNSISDFISAVLCALKALLCLISSTLNLRQTFEDSAEMLKENFENLIDSIGSSTESLIDSILEVTDDILETFGINVKGMCKGDCENILKNDKLELEKYAEKVFDEFKSNVSRLINNTLKCRYISVNSDLGYFKKFHFGFYPALPPKNLLKIPDC